MADRGMKSASVTCEVHGCQCWCPDLAEKANHRSTFQCHASSPRSLTRLVRRRRHCVLLDDAVLHCSDAVVEDAGERDNVATTFDNSLTVRR